MANVHPPPLILPFVRRRDTENAELDLWVVKAMIGKTNFGGVEVGFFAYIADRALKA